MSEEMVKMWNEDAQKEIKKEIFRNVEEIKVGNIDGYFIAIVPTPFIGKTLEVEDLEGNGENRVVLSLEYKGVNFQTTYPYEEGYKAGIILSIDKVEDNEQSV